MMKNLRLLLLSVLFIALSQSTFACIASTQTVANTTVTHISVKKKMNLLNRFKRQKVGDDSLPIVIVFFMGAILCGLLSIWAFATANAEAAAAVNTWCIFCGLGSFLLGLLLAVVAVVFLILFFVKLSKMSSTN